MLRISINPKYNDIKEFINNIPSLFETEGNIDYEGRNIIKTIDFNGVSFNIKSFKKPNFINKFVYTNFRESKAKRSFEYANSLMKNQVKTPDPVAYIEEKKGLLLSRSYYITIHEKFDGIMREFHTGELQGRERLLTYFARFTANLHQKKILHIDYSPGNILYKTDNDSYEFYLVDLNRMEFGKEISMDKGCYNMRKLWGNNEMIGFVAREYAKSRGFDEEKCVELVLKYHKQFWNDIAKRHPGYSPYLSE